MALDSSHDQVFNNYLDAAVKRVKKALEGGGVVILVPPGSAKDKVVGELARKNIIQSDDLLLYEELYKRVGVGRPLRRVEDQFYVGKQPLLHYLKRGVTLGSKLRKAVIVPRDTWEALLIRDVLLEALEEKWTIGGIKKLVKVLFLPALYNEGDKKVVETAMVDYCDVLKRVVKNAMGVSPSLARLAKEYETRGGLGDLKQLIAAVRSLAPRQSANTWYDLAGEVAGGFASEAAREAAGTVPGVLAAGAVLVIMGLNPLAIVTSAVAGWAARKIVAKLWELLRKARERESDIIRGARHLIREVRRLYSHFCRKRAEELERLEAVVDEVAAKWGMSIDQFKNFVCSLGALTTSRVVTEEELEERLRRLEDLALLKATAPTAVYVEAWEWPYVAEVGKGLVVLEGAVKGPYVETKLEAELAERLDVTVEEVRRGAGRVVLLRGAKGVGKSTAAAVALYKLLKRGRAAVAVFDLGAAVDEVKTVQFLSEARSRGLVPVLYLDPSRVEFYSSHTQAGPPVQAVDNLAKLVELAKRHGAVALMVLSDDQAEAIARSEELGEETKKMLLSDVDAVKASDVVEVEPFVKALVEKYSGCPSDVIEGTANAVASSFRDCYAVAAVLAADWLKRGGCRGEEVERAVKETGGNVHRFVLYYLWYGLFNGSDAVASQYAPLLLAVGFFGPHPPKLAKAVIRAFGGEPEDAVVRWFSQPQHGTLYETIRKVAHGAVYRRFGVGDDELCQGSGEGPCRFVEICSETLARIPPRRYGGVEEVAVEYAKVVAEVLKTPWSTKRRPIDALIQDFLLAHNGVVEGERWKIRYKVKGREGVKVVEDIVNKTDVYSALYGIAALPGWHPQLELLEEWFFVGDKKVEVTGLYLYPILREKSGELVKRITAIVDEAKRRGFYTDVDFWRAVGIVAAGKWESVADEELERAVELAAFALNRFATARRILLDYVKSLLSEAWRRVVSGETHGGVGRRQGLADKLTVVVHSVAKGHPLSLLDFFLVVDVDKPDLEAVAKRFDALYNAASNAGKLQLLDLLLYVLQWNIGGVNVAAALLSKPQLKPWEAFEEVVKRVEELASYLDGVERAYVVARLYPRLAARYTSFDEFSKAMKLVEEEILKALEELWKAYEKDKASMEEKLRPYLELSWVKPELERELNELSWYVYHVVARVYIDSDELDKAVEYAEKACKLARRLGDVYYEVSSCGLLSRLRAVRGGAPPVEEIEEVWQRASQDVGELGAEAIAATFGEYVVALASAGRLGDVEKLLEEWGWALELHPMASALTHGVLSLFDGRHLEKAVEGLPEGARANLPNFADALHDAVEAGVFSKEPEIAMSAVETLTVVYGRDVVKALLELASTSNNLFLFALVGLAYCKKGEEWGLKLTRAATRAGSQLSKGGIDGRLFDELYKALEGVAVGNCVTEEVLSAVYKLYYLHV